MNAGQFLSYRDHDATVIKVEDTYYRKIHQQYKEAYNHLMESGLYQALLNRNLMIGHQEVEALSQDQNVYKTLLPEQISFISYPFEWTLAQWIQAAEAYIKINRIALLYGMILKDATPYNFYFQGGNAILLDTSSFMLYEEGKPWTAYKQFCEAFFGPIALMHYNGEEWTRLLKSKNELSLPFISRQLAYRSYCNATTAIHIHWHSRFYTSKKKPSDSVKGLSKEKIDLLLQGFISTIRKWKKKEENSSHWIHYYEADLESEQYLPSKESIVITWVNNISPYSILDLGANTGHFTKVLAHLTHKIIAIEHDLQSVASIAKWIKETRGNNVYVVAADITDPIDGTGFLNLETRPLLSRSKAELILGLALIHHLFFTKRLSLFHIAELFNTLSQKWVIVEFIPEEDAKIEQLKAGLPVYQNAYSEETLLAAFSTYFNCKDQQVISGSKRKLFLFEKYNTSLEES